MSFERLTTPWWALRVALGAAAFLAGLDKFFNLLADWPGYLSPLAAHVLPMSATSFITQVNGIAPPSNWATDVPTANANADALLDRTSGVEASITLRQAMRVVLAASGKLTVPALFAAALDPEISALYLSSGFRPVGQRAAYYRNPKEDALVLWLALEQHA